MIPGCRYPATGVLRGNRDTSYTGARKSGPLSEESRPERRAGEAIVDITHTGDRPAGFGKNRIEALTDGVYAIALTLLVLGVEVPRTMEESVPAAELLVSLIPDFFQYILAFIVLAVLWTIHHEQFHHIRFIDRTLLWLNMLTLMFITMIPFSSSFADTYISEQIAGVFFATNLVIIGLLIIAQWEHATKSHRLISPDLDPCEILFEKRKNLAIPILGICAIALTFIGFGWASGIFYLLPAVLFFLHRWHDRVCRIPPGFRH
jgi:uncharacterized membrane protein